MPEQVASFNKALKEKKIDIKDLLSMSTKKRIEVFKEYAGSRAKEVNDLFEQKLVLKNKMIGLRNWASKVGEQGKYSPEKKAELDAKVKEYKDKQFKRMFDPKKEESFLSSLVEKKFGTEITREQAKKVFELTSKAEELKGKFNEETGKWDDKESALRYGSAKVELEKYVDALKNPEISVKEGLQKTVEDFKEEYAENKPEALSNLGELSLKTLNDNTVAFAGSLDNSFLGRQGLKTLMTHPSAWYPAAKQSFIDIFKTMVDKKGGQQAIDALMADMYSRENYTNGNYKKADIVPKVEEQYPTNLPERLPSYLGRSFKASEIAFKGSALRMRMDLFDLLYDVAKSNNKTIKNDVLVEDIGRGINSMTARGRGKIVDSEVTRLFLWAPRMLKGNWDVLTAHSFGTGLKTSFMRKQAITNLIKITAELSAIALILNSIDPGTVETDPRSADFMKAKINDTRFDLTGGMGSIATLIARALSGSTKNQAGEIQELNTGEYGARNMFDVGMDFLVNKTTPLTRTGINFLRGTDQNFEKTTIGGELFSKLPITLQGAIKTSKKPTPEAIVGTAFDTIGINSTTYSKPLPKLKSLKKLGKPGELKKLKKLKPLQ